VYRILIGCLVGISCFGLLSIANAETIVLDNGQKVTGQIIERTELRVMVDIDGTPRTFFLGEIASIDGQAVSMPQDDKVNSDLSKVEQNAAGGDQDKLVKEMVERGQTVAKVDAPAVPSSTVATAVATDQSSISSSATSTGPNKAVVTTPDGGIIVVDNSKITKYDKDFKVVKEVAINSDNVATAPASVAPASADAPASAPAVAPAAPAPNAAAPAAATTTPTPAATAPAAAPATPVPADASADQPPTLKDFLSSIFSSHKK